MSEPLPIGTRVLFWPGAKTGTGQCGTTIALPSEMGGQRVVRIRKVRGGTDYIALTHIEPLRSRAAS